MDKFNLLPMLAAIQKLLKLKPWYIGLYLVVVVILAGSSYIEFRSRYRDLLQLIQNQAAMTAAVIAQSGSGQAYLAEELKQAYIDRAIDVLTILNKVDAKEDLGTNRLDELVNQSNILKIVIYDTRGQVEHTVLKDPTQSDNLSREGERTRRLLEPILSGQKDLVVAGTGQENNWHSLEQSPGTDREIPFFVAIRRDRGGALACHLTMNAEADFKYLTAIETALEELLNVKGLEYLKLTVDDREPYYISKHGLVVDSSWNREPLEDILFRVSKGDIRLLEVVRPVFFNTNFGEVRIGFKADNLTNLRGQIIIQILIRTTLLTILAFVILIFLITRQNAALLAREKKRIEAEVHRLEKRHHQREKQVAMGELAAGVAHEIRNPLNAIGIVAQRLRREFDPRDNSEEYGTLTGTMVTEIQRINHSLQDFLEYTRPTPLKFSKIQLNNLLRQILDLYRSQALEKQVDLKVETNDLTIEADQEFLQQALSNIVKNAIEACESGDTVSIFASTTDTGVRITIRDTGIGIDIEHQSRIFDLYYTTKDMGTGVGLALTHKIIADHGGTIEVNSEPERGSIFEINLPVTQ